MDKRLAKRHKRQVARAKERMKISEPDLRTQEEIEAAREKSRPEHTRGDQPKVAASARTFRRSLGTTTSSAAKTDG